MWTTAIILLEHFYQMNFVPRRHKNFTDNTFYHNKTKIWIFVYKLPGKKEGPDWIIGTTHKLLGHNVWWNWLKFSDKFIYLSEWEFLLT